MTKKDIKIIIDQLKKNELSILAVPDEVKHNKEIIHAERKLGLRRELERGYDIIGNRFFVIEELVYTNIFKELASKENRLFFETFEEYYDYLDGDIYDNSCYKYCNFEKYKSFIKSKKINVSKLKQRDSLVTNTIDDLILEVSQEEEAKYDEVEKKKKTIKEWIRKFEACTSGFDLEVLAEKYQKSKLHETVDLAFFFSVYLQQNTSDMDRFNAVMEYVCTGKYPEYKITRALCLLYKPEMVIEKYDYKGGASSTNSKHKKELKNFVELLCAGKVSFNSQCYFDTETHYYSEEVKGYDDKQRWPIVTLNRYFESFEELVAYRKGNLKGADLSAAIRLDVDFSQYSIDEKTRIPISSVHDFNIHIEKKYTEIGIFRVTKRWETQSGILIKEKVYRTPFFFDFVYFLKNDLTNANLLFCDGLSNLDNLDGLKTDGIRMRSQFCDKFKIDYKKVVLNRTGLITFHETERNEKENLKLMTLQQNTNEIIAEDFTHSLSTPNEYDRSCQRITYITDLHLEFRIDNANCQSEDDIFYVLTKIVRTIVSESSHILLIGGDVSSTPELFHKFVEMLKDRLANCSKKVIFILGNHELWQFPGFSVDEIVEKYREIIKMNGMYLLHNNLLYLNCNDELVEINEAELLSEYVSEIRKKVLSTRLVLFGGIGFAKYNKKFNANQGIYRDTLNREEEIVESQRFEDLYNRVIPIILDKNSIVFTHFPKGDWSINKEPSKGVVYVSGHSHRNEFYDDGDYRMYYDNQIGYHNENVHLKSLLMDNEYDCFSDYQDGIYSITREQYNDFYRGKNLLMNFTREINKLYMLKKQNYYCFIHETKGNSLSILNGGSLKKLRYKNIDYYYEHMDEVIESIQEPLKKYTDFQNKISTEIRKIGGTGTIHGCIIDINWFNHIYVNPVDSSITAYYAESIVYKYVYPDVVSLLQTECPSLYSNYQKLIKSNNTTEGALIISEPNKIQVLPQEYLSTDIYKASREIKKMQKLGNNILSTWIEPSMGDKALNGEYGLPNTDSQKTETKADIVLKEVIKDINSKLNDGNEKH